MRDEGNWFLAAFFFIRDQDAPEHPDHLIHSLRIVGCIHQIVAEVQFWHVSLISEIAAWLSCSVIEGPQALLGYRYRLQPNAIFNTTSLVVEKLRFAFRVWFISCTVATHARP